MYRKKQGSRAKSSDVKQNTNIAKRSRRRQTNFEKNCPDFGVRRCKTSSSNKANDEGVASGRVAVPLSLFDQGPLPKPTNKKCNDENLNVTNENDHSGTAQPLRRSKRILEKSPRVQAHYQSVSDYYVKLQSQHIPPDRIKSRFTEINHQFRQTVEQPELNKSCCDNVSLLCDTAINGSNSGFCRNLEHQLASVSLNSRKLKCVGKICTLISQIDAVLDGKKADVCVDAKAKSKTKPLNEENATYSCLVPKFRWLYETPVNQRLKRPVVSNTVELKPCIMYTNNNSKVLMELNPTVNLNLLQKTLKATPLGTFSPFGVKNSVIFEQHNMVSRGQENLVPFYSTSFPVSVHNTFNRSPTDGAPKHFNFKEINEQRQLFAWQNEDETYNLPFNVNRHLHNANLPCTVTSESFQLPFYSQEASSQDSRQFKQDFVMDEQFLLPPVPELEEPSPLTFFPRKTFGSD